eukprot:SAG31_NODE_20660_length_568_cov_1.219616_2_plen_33_part_01
MWPLFPEALGQHDQRHCTVVDKLDLARAQRLQW